MWPSYTYGRSPLWWAAENRHEAVVKLLLEKGAEPDSREGGEPRTPLSRAAVNGHEAVVKLLLEKGVKPDSRERGSGRTPLSQAAVNGHEAVVKLLLEKGALYATTAPYPPPRGYSPPDLALEGPRYPRQVDLGNWDHCSNEPEGIDAIPDDVQGWLRQLVVCYGEPEHSVG
jgi:Ankyrin repeats (3 copies)